MIEANESNINDVISSGKSVVVLFFASWCPFCRKFKPIFEGYERKTGETSLFEAMIDDETNPLWDAFKIEVVPTLVAFKGGKIISRRDGKAGIGLSSSDMESLLKEIQAKRA